MTTPTQPTRTRDVRLPALSATMETATLIEWRVNPGETVTEGQAIAEVETDKVDMEVEAPFSGTVISLELHPGDELPVGGVLATVDADDDDLLGFLDQPHSTEVPESAEVPESDKSAPIVKAVPAARRLARDSSVDLTQLTPTGARGQVTVEDVKSVVQESERLNTERPSPESQATEPNRDHRVQANRRATATVVSRSAAIPQFTLYRQLDLTYAGANKSAEGWTTIFVRALAGALRQHPDVNVQWSDETSSPVPLDAVRVGIAVDRPGIGLTTATATNPDHGDRQTADRMVRLIIDRARAARAVPDDLAPAAVTLSNLGSFGVDRFDALVIPPQAAIMSVGAIAMRAVATATGGVRAALTCDVGLTFDHRIADGADGARFLATFADIVERSR